MKDARTYGRPHTKKGEHTPPCPLDEVLRRNRRQHIEPGMLVKNQLDEALKPARVEAVNGRNVTVDGEEWPKGPFNRDVLVVVQDEG